MFIGKWNKSVILTYIGVTLSIIGIFICFSDIDRNLNYALTCLILVGICDMLDGTVARKCKRTAEEKAFGMQLDSLADVVDFIALPTVIFMKSGLTAWYQVIVIAMFAICGVARLAHFNITAENSNKPVKYYEGLPVTITALVFALAYLLYFLIPIEIFKIIITVFILCVAILNISKNVKIKKTSIKGYIFFSILAIVVIILYVGVF